MIHPDSRTLAWIEKVAKDNNVKDIALAEKTIRAFSLLEALVRSGCPLLFKGGTAEMLHLHSAKRLSIDVDIICPPGTQIEDYLKVYSSEYGFGDVELVERISRSDIPKKHAKYNYQVSYPEGGKQDKILLACLRKTTILKWCHFQSKVPSLRQRANQSWSTFPATKTCLVTNSQLLRHIPRASRSSRATKTALWKSTSNCSTLPPCST